MVRLLAVLPSREHLTGLCSWQPTIGDSTIHGSAEGFTGVEVSGPVKETIYLSPSRWWIKLLLVWNNNTSTTRTFTFHTDMFSRHMWDWTWKDVYAWFISANKREKSSGSSYLHWKVNCSTGTQKQNLPPTKFQWQQMCCEGAVSTGFISCDKFGLKPWFKNVSFKVNTFATSLPLLLHLFWIAKYPLSTWIFPFPSVTATTTSRHHLEVGDCTKWKIPQELFKIRSEAHARAAHDPVPLIVKIKYCIIFASFETFISVFLSFICLQEKK